MPASPPSPLIDDALPWAARLGQGLRSLAWGLLAVGGVQVMQLSRWFDDGTGLRQLAAIPLLVLAWLAAAAAVHAAGTVLLEHALRRRHPNAAAVLAADPRPPVLYLRPFDEDLRQARQQGWLRFFPAPTVGLSLELRVSHLLGGLGPLVAIGRPGEALPPRGFARLYARDEDWQATVLDLLSRAAAVVLVAGSSPGLRWEIDQVMRHVPWTRVLFIIPAWPGHDQAAFERLMAEHLGLRIPPLDPALNGPFPHDIRAVLRFDATGQPLLHEWDWRCAPAAERGPLKRRLFRGFGGRGVPAYAALDGLADQHFDRAVAHLLRPAGLPPPDAAATQQQVTALAQQRHLVRIVAVGTAVVLLLAVAVAAWWQGA